MARNASGNRDGTKVRWNGREWCSKWECTVAQLLESYKQRGDTDPRIVRVEYDDRTAYTLFERVLGLRATSRWPSVPTKRSITYSPDFRVTFDGPFYPIDRRGLPCGSEILIEAKGFMREDAALKLRAFAFFYPDLPLYVVRTESDVRAIFEGARAAKAYHDEIAGRDHPGRSLGGRRKKGAA